MVLPKLASGFTAPNSRTSVFSNFTCQCSPAYSGFFCETEINPANNSPSAASAAPGIGGLPFWLIGVIAGGVVLTGILIVMLVRRNRGIKAKGVANLKGREGNLHNYINPAFSGFGSEYVTLTIKKDPLKVATETGYATVDAKFSETGLTNSNYSKANYSKETEGNGGYFKDNRRSSINAYGRMSSHASPSAIERKATASQYYDALARSNYAELPSSGAQYQYGNVLNPEGVEAYSEMSLVKDAKTSSEYEYDGVPVTRKAPRSIENTVPKTSSEYEYDDVAKNTVPNANYIEINQNGNANYLDMNQNSSSGNPNYLDVIGPLPGNPNYLDVSSKAPPGVSPSPSRYFNVTNLAATPPNLTPPAR